MFSTHSRKWFFLSLLALPLSQGWAALVNRTIDDEFGDSVTGETITYYPPDASSWKQGNNCTDCVIHLDASQAWRGTWHDGTQHTDDPEVRSITARFNGTAVYVYNALAAYEYPHVWTMTYLEFDIDGHKVGNFSSDAHGEPRYDVPVYVNDSLADGAHTLIIRVPPSPVNGTWSLVLFDYIVYTTSTDSTSTPPSSPTSSEPTTSSSPPSTSSFLPQSPSPSIAAAPATTRITSGAIAGATLGAVAILLVGVMMFFVRPRFARSHATSRRNRSNYPDNATLPEGLPSPPDPDRRATDSSYSRYPSVPLGWSTRRTAPQRGGIRTWISSLSVRGDPRTGSGTHGAEGQQPRSEYVSQGLSESEQRARAGIAELLQQRSRIQEFMDGSSTRVSGSSGSSGRKPW